MADKHDTHLNSPSRVRAKMKPHAPEAPPDQTMPSVDAAVSPPATQGHDAVLHDAPHKHEGITQENVSSPHNSTTSLARIEDVPPKRRGGQHPTPEERSVIQEAFLTSFSRTANVSTSCQVANIDRTTIYRWLKEDEVFEERYREAELVACDVLRQEVFRRAVDGVPEPVISMGKLVYKEVPVLDENGQQRYDIKGKPMMRPTEPLTVPRYSDALLTLLVKSKMPEFRDKVDLTASGSINVAAVSAHQLTIDVRNMNADELAEVRRIAQAMKDREEGRHDNG